MKKKWFRAMDLADEKYVEEAAPNRQVTPLRKKRIVTALVASAACLALTLTGLWLFMPFDNNPPSIEHHKENDYYAVIEKLNALKKEETEYNNRYEVIVDEVEDMFLAGTKGEAMNGNPGEAAPDAAAPGDRGDGDFQYTGTTGEITDDSTYEEVTDNQVAGILEADRIKRSSTHIYYLDGDTLKIFKIAGLESEEVGKVNLSKGGDQGYVNQWAFYLSADCKTATVMTQYLNSEKKTCVNVVSVDVSDPANPVEKNRVEVTGNYLSSRVTDGKILLITQFAMSKQEMDFEKEETFLPQINGQSIPADCIILPEEVNATRYTVVLKLDEKTLAFEGKSALLSYSEDVYVSKDHIFLTHVYKDVQKSVGYSIRNSMTEITCLNYNNLLEKVGSAVVRGYVKDQWSMDEYEGILRVVTTTNATKVAEKSAGNYISAEILSTATGESNASLYCVDLESFKVVASVEDFAPPYEEVRSARFDGTTAYVCTAIEVSDPVYFFDLSNLDKITYKETGNIDGFSSSLVNMGNGYLLGIGQENWSNFKIEIYEETENAVEGFCKYVLENVDYSQNYKSYYIDRKNQLIGLGIVDYSGKYNGKENSRYILLHFDGYTLVELLNVELKGNPELMRGVYIDGFMYLFGEEDFQVLDAFNNRPVSRDVAKIRDLVKEENLTCDTAMELFYEDETALYYFPCIKSQYVKVVYQNGETEDIVSALKAGRAKIADLDKFGIEYYIKLIQ